MKYSTGDTARINTRGCRYHDQTDTTTINQGQHHPYQVDGLAPWGLWFADHELAAAPQAQEPA